MFDPGIIGHIVAVQGFRVKVELLAETKSASRATLDGVQNAVAINAYLTFSIGAGDVVIGIITDLDARESFDPSSSEELTLELIKPRRLASVQLLRTIDHESGRPTFNPGITVLPTLDTPAVIGSSKILQAVFENPPRRNKPDGYPDEDFDTDLALGHPTGQRNAKVRASYNDLFSRPLAIVGNTGSGKSFTVSSLVQKAMKSLDNRGNEPHIFILDINGEYGRAFTRIKTPGAERVPNRIYLNGQEFGVPLWLMNAEEICAWLSASEQTQEPVLKDWWAIAKAEGHLNVNSSANMLQHALSTIDTLLTTLPRMQRKAAGSYCDAVVNSLCQTTIQTNEFESCFTDHKRVDKYNQEIVSNQPDILTHASLLRDSIRAELADDLGMVEQQARTADSPLFISKTKFFDPILVGRTISAEDTHRVEGHLATLKLRLRTRLDDRRWQSFLNYQDKDTEFPSLAHWLKQFGLGEMDGPQVSVIDLSMLSHEVLPYACTIIGRILLECREVLRAERRYKNPWVLVLEEAHNYARPAHHEEDRGQVLSRLAFERIAKEGRKFGLSLIIASQRPSEISPTIISQCANFISHRLQNPDDIDHFRRIIPMQARRLLDQVTILASGEAIVFGSAFHVPTRVQFDRPEPGPYSQTAAPYLEWRTDDDPFPLATVLAAWGLQEAETTELPPDDWEDDEIPY